jgi:hypothetical protein
MKNDFYYLDDSQDNNDYDPNNDPELEISPEEWSEIEEETLDIMFPDRDDEDFDPDRETFDSVFGDE